MYQNDYNDSIYSDIGYQCAEKNTDQILELYNNNDEDSTNEILDMYSSSTSHDFTLMPLPISAENMDKLKMKWKKNLDAVNINKREKVNIWNKIKTKLSPNKSLYEILTK